MACKTMQRFKVTFRNQRIFINAGDEAGALALARVRFIKIYKEAGVIEDMPELATSATFNAVAQAVPVVMV